jgi:levanase/fructan beta-fructosidase
MPSTTENMTVKRDDFKRFGVFSRQHSAFCNGELGWRDFLKSVAATLVAAGAALGAVGEVAADNPAAKAIPAEPLYHEALRPQFHFTARYWDDYNLDPGNDGREGWINDVNGLIYFDGEYHLFAQRWWHCWLHAVSKDLVHWEELPPAFGKDEKFGGTQSGTCVIDYRNVSGLATGSTPVMVAFWAAVDNKRQCISYSNDHGRTWTKYAKNPVLEHPYRDPKVFWHEPSRKWIMVLCGPPDFHYYILTSSNLLQWEEQSKIPDMYECPDMFPLPVDGDAAKTKWVIVNGDGKYLEGDFDGRDFKPLSGKKQCEWGRNFYATQSWNNLPKSDPRRIQVAWMRGGKYPDMPFNQQWSFPCELTLRTRAGSPALRRFPIREIEKLWDEKMELGPISLQPGDDPLAKLTGKYYDIDLEIDLGGSDASEIVLELAGSSKVRYLVKEKILESCGARAELAPEANRIELRILLDRTSIEAFGNHGAVSLTNCILPNDGKPPLSIGAVAGKAKLTRLTLHKLTSMWR